MTTALTYQVTSTVLSDCYTAVMRCERPASELPAWLSSVFGRVSDYLAREGVKPAGPPFARFTFLGHLAAAEAGFPVPREIPGDGVVEPSTLPDGPAAVATHYGHYRDVEMAYRACRAWLDDHGYDPAGPHWEVYYTDPGTEPDPARWRTDVVVPFHR
ncbi:MAG: GyrI-like domain-containing protein [Micromonosporaceae bacterium]